ncbi:uncharacterized protein Ecym_5338 [Eremothecium cymbalariae DBVPG|uniref:CREG-like beta-barrel domain-containing protein n=1 Tax=Eremothecium cymbalariae (strain CBS 270.75 / DBVPG 7215 / KCTC 17166 / NRRL Y-17582) TaxID=931890 RepID=I6NDF5_ERECY|nr:hypothetical protein Ecym_5338 [Eremothecium cymbalariae DBVPG\
MVSLSVRLSVLLQLFCSVVLSRETLEDAAKNLRKIMYQQSALHVNTIDRNSADPASFIEYHVSSDKCDGVDHNGNPILVLVDMSSSIRNWNENQRISVTVEDTFSCGTIMSSPRATLFGKLTEMNTTAELTSCFKYYHPDAEEWMPKQSVEQGHHHTSKFYQLEVERIYYLGGFGDVSYIGPIEAELYRSS